VVAALAQKDPWPELLNSLPEMGNANDSRIKQLSFFLIDKLAGLGSFHSFFTIVRIHRILSFGTR
jgi:hypothetical protein